VVQQVSAPEDQPATATASFPYRRVKMNPKEGIFAEAAGSLLWPLYGTPFQVLYND
jgi:hypothetical protein